MATHTNETEEENKNAKIKKRKKIMKSCIDTMQQQNVEIKRKALLVKYKNELKKAGISVPKDNRTLNDDIERAGYIIKNQLVYPAVQILPPEVFEPIAKKVKQIWIEIRATSISIQRYPSTYGEEDGEDTEKDKKELSKREVVNHYTMRINRKHPRGNRIHLYITTKSRGIEESICALFEKTKNFYYTSAHRYCAEIVFNRKYLHKHLETACLLLPDKLPDNKKK